MICTDGAIYYTCRKTENIGQKDDYVDVLLADIFYLNGSLKANGANNCDYCQKKVDFENAYEIFETNTKKIIDKINELDE